MSETASDRRVVVVGNLTIDDVVAADGRTSMGSAGGNSIYSALAARLFTDRVGIVTRCGEDFPREHLDRLAECGVELDGVRDVAGPTVRNWVLYELDGSRTWIYRTPVERSREVAVQPEDLPPSWLAGAAPVVHVAAMPLPAARAIVDRVRAECPGATITLDTHEDWVADHREALIELARRVDVFVPSRDELTALVGYDEPERAAKELHSLGVATVVAKLGADGALLSCEAWTGMLHAVPTAAVDATGAGDAFCGGLAAGIAAGDEPPMAVHRGCVAASFAVESFGSMALADVQRSTAVARMWGRAHGDDEADADADSERYDIAVMLDEIGTIPDVLARHLSDPDGSVQSIAELLVERGVEHLFLTGCGDSAFAGSVTALAFVKYAGLHVEAVHALELARYRSRYLPPNSAVLALSFSGKVARTAEALIQARRAGHLTIALTNNATSVVGTSAEHILPIDVPTLGFSPGTSTYLGMVATLLDLAVRWGTRRGLDTAVSRAVCDRLPALAARTLDLDAGASRRAAEVLANQAWVSYLGAGPNEGTARFGAAKLFEGPQVMGVATNIEEWAHEEYFVSGAGTPIVVVAPRGAAFSRAEEILSEIAFIGARAIVVSDAPVTDSAVLLRIADGVPEEFTPVLCALPLSLMGFHLADLLGKRSYNFPSEDVRTEHYDTIHRLTIGDPA